MRHGNIGWLLRAMMIAVSAILIASSTSVAQAWEPEKWKHPSSKDANFPGAAEMSGCSKDSLGTWVCFSARHDRIYVADRRADGFHAAAVVRTEFSMHGLERSVMCHNYLGKRKGWTVCDVDFRENQNVYIYAKTLKGTKTKGVPGATKKVRNG